MKKPRSYLFSSKKRSYPGLTSMAVGIICMVSVIVMVWQTYEDGGKAQLRYGAVVFVCALLSVGGLVTGILARREPDKVYLPAWIGIVLNSIVLVLCFIIMYLGLM